jgi:hypothetical protein
MSPVRLVLAASIALAACGALAGCPPNEAKVCGSSTQNAGSSCSATYDLCASGTSLRIECAPGTGGGVTCSCLENGAKKSTFQSADACSVSPDTLKKRAASGCTWDIIDDE